ncbi:FtsH protease activity modulator HflK [candidate division NPL-UPA2 bacterium]|nr:FtsH protease activity modulator HflK [candidate division NPL-UPA2 bacterium]
MKWDEVTPAKIIGGQGEEDFKQMLKSARPFMKFGIPIVILLWFLSGIYIVGPGEIGVVRQFGGFISQTDPGLNYRLPWPIQAVDVVNVAEIRRAEIGFRTVEEPRRPARHARVLGEAMMLTGDKNIAEVQVLILYQVKDPVRYLFRAEAPDMALRVNAEVALRSVIGEMAIDHAMTVGRPEVEVGTWGFLQILLDDHQTGLHVVGVELQVVDPPDEVREAFYDVVRAKADKERFIREAEGYARDVVPRARGEAAAMIHAATAHRDAKIALAQGEAERFIKVLQEYQKAPAVTRQRLFLETIERVLAETEKFIIDPAVGGGLLQFLPLRDFEPGAMVAPGGGER